MKHSMKLKEQLRDTMEQRKAARDEFFKTYKQPTTTAVNKAFVPLPSDLIEDKSFWTEWELDKKLNVVPSDEMSTIELAEIVKTLKHTTAVYIKAFTMLGDRAAEATEEIVSKRFKEKFNESL